MKAFLRLSDDDLSFLQNVLRLAQEIYLEDARTARLAPPLGRFAEQFDLQASTAARLAEQFEDAESVELIKTDQRDDGSSK